MTGTCWAAEALTPNAVLRVEVQQPPPVAHDVPAILDHLKDCRTFGGFLPVVHGVHRGSSVTM
jgi:hypothetical protein